jgi:hypothetical protein
MAKKKNEEISLVWVKHCKEASENHLFMSAIANASAKLETLAE